MLVALTHIIDRIRAGETFDAHDIDVIVRERNRATHDGERTVAKRRLMSRYLKERAEDSDAWRSWSIDEDTHRKVVSTLRAKPRRTASGVATITVLTKPWPCSSDCIYCPSDIRMPKSYMSDEPACQRAERNCFDPYLQVASRLAVLEDMGHITDKVELIVLGGTWSDYGRAYRIWFTSELFRALNEFEDRDVDGKLLRADRVAKRRACYESAGIASDATRCAARAEGLQALVDAGELTYNEAMARLHDEGNGSGEERTLGDEDALMEGLFAQQRANETGAHRVVGLVFETRPDKVHAGELAFMRTLGATKVQMGIQSLDATILRKNRRFIDEACIADAFALLRLFGFKTHIHLMANLVGATPATDIEQYGKLVGDDRFKPDEVKLYPCALVRSAALTELYDAGAWRPYTEDQLLEVLVADVLATPPYTRISRMIRDISATDILVGNKKTNLRQLVEERAWGTGGTIQEMRMREISTGDVDADALQLEAICYSTGGSEEVFLQWVDGKRRLAGFLRLSLPAPELIERITSDEAAAAGLFPGAAMIREVHVYGKVSKLHESREGAQHLGLGRSMVEAACATARDAGYASINVISAVGTRDYYRRLGFVNRGLYLNRNL